MRYGTLPIVRATGGLVDTVANYDEGSGTGTGFVFHDLRPDSLADTIGWAVSTWYDRPAHHVDAMRRRAMAQDHSWDQAAQEYARLYLRAYARRRGHAFAEAVPPQRDGVAERDPRDAAHPSAGGMPDARTVRGRVSATPMPFDRLPPLPARRGRAPAVRIPS